MTHLSELVQPVAGLANARVLCVGDIMLDRYIYGEAERLSPEAPVPVLHVRLENMMLGGVGNVARNIISLGAGVAVCSAIGDDAPARELMKLLADLPGCTAAVVSDEMRSTTQKTRCVVGQQQIVRIDRENVQPLTESVEQTLLETTMAHGEVADVVVISDYGKGVLTPSFLSGMFAWAMQHEKITIVDPKGRDYSRYRGASVVTPNCKELSEATGISVSGDESVVHAAQKLIDDYGFAAVLATRSEEGMSLITRAGDIRHLPTEAREVFDVSGAGDTVVAVLAAALATGVDLEAAARLANIAAGIVVGKVGTATVTQDELHTALRHQNILDIETKIVSWPRARAIVDRWREEGLRVGFTNGSFDLVHPGHIVLLAKARAKCDRLVVGLNSDASVSRLKGPLRPVQTEVARATVLAAMSAVNLVVVFEEDTPLELITELRPDVLFKGSDYTIDNVVGADVVQSYGGSVLLIDVVPEQSTSRIVNRIYADRVQGAQAR